MSESVLFCRKYRLSFSLQIEESSFGLFFVNYSLYSLNIHEVSTL